MCLGLFGPQINQIRISYAEIANDSVTLFEPVDSNK